MTAVAYRESGQWRGSSARRQIVVLTGRSLRPLLRDPLMIVMSMLQPLIMLLLFSQVFRSIAQTPGFPAGVSYIDYLLPAIVVTTSLGTGLQAGVILCDDARNGFMGRLRSLPVQPMSTLIARSNADTVRGALQVAVLVILAYTAFGFRPAGGITGIAAAALLSIVVSWSMGWLFLALGVWIRRVEQMQLVSTMALFPAMFASNAFVPAENLPSWLATVAAGNPLSHAITAARVLTLGQPAGHEVTVTVMGCAVLVVVGVTASVHGLRRWRQTPPL